MIFLRGFPDWQKQAPPPLHIFERISGHQQKKAPPPLDIFERISGLAETSTTTPWYFWEDFRSSAKTSIATPWYFWEDFLFLQKYFQKLILFSIPKFFETNIKFFETDTFFDTKNFRNRYRYFFRYQIFPKPIPILFSIPKFSETDTDTIKKNQKVSKPRSFETEMSNSDDHQP